MDTKELLILGGVGVAAYILLTPNAQGVTPVAALAASTGVTIPGLTTTTAAGTTVPVTATSSVTTPAPTSSGIPTSPTGVWNKQWYLTYQFPAMAAINPNILNANYVMSDAEAQQYINNYNDLKPQYLNAAPAYWGTTPLNRARYHWRSYGVPDQRTFLPLVPMDTDGQEQAVDQYAPKVVAAPKKSSSIFGDILGVVGAAAPYVAALAGSPELGSYDQKIILSGAAVAKQLLPFYIGDPAGLALQIDTHLNNVLSTAI